MEIKKRKDLIKTKDIVNELVEMSGLNMSDKTKQKFILLCIAFITWLTASYTIDLTKDIIFYTQLIDLDDNLIESFERIKSLLKIADMKLNCME